MKQLSPPAFASEKGLRILSDRPVHKEKISSSSPILTEKGWLGIPHDETGQHPVTPIQLTEGLCLARIDGGYLLHLGGIDRSVRLQNILSGDKEIYP